MEKEIIFKEKRKRPSDRGAGVATIITIACWLWMFLSGIAPFGELSEKCGFIGAEILSLAFIYIAFMTSIIVHEAGHLIFGLLSGYGFCSFRIFSFLFIKTEEGIRLKKYSIPGTAGQCLLMPPEKKKNKTPTILYNLGGSLLGVIGFIGLMSIVKYVIDKPTLAVFVVCLATANLSTALTNGIPLRTAAINNDGMNIVSLLKDPDAIHDFQTHLLLNVESSKGVTVDEMPEEWFGMPRDEKLGNAMMATSAYLYCVRLFLLGKYDEARDKMEHLFEIDAALIGLYRAQLLADLAFIASIQGDGREARRILKEELPLYYPMMRGNLALLRSRYAYELLVKKSEKGAKRILILMNMRLEKLKNYAFTRELEREKGFIEYVDSLYRARINNA